MNRKFWHSYLKGGLLHLVLLFGMFWFFNTLSFPTINFSYLIILYVAITFVVGLFIKRFDHNFGLGFMTALLAVVLFFALFIIELIIHPPSEE